MMHLRTLAIGFASTAIVATALVVAPTSAWAEYVLPPTAAAKIQSGFAAATPPWRLTRGDVARTQVKGSAASPDGTAVTFLLEHDSPACPGRHAGTFCVTLGPGAEGAHVDGLVSALAQLAEADIWIDVRPGPEPGEGRDAPNAAAPNAATPNAADDRGDHRQDGGHQGRGERDGQRRGTTLRQAEPLPDHGAVLVAIFVGLLVGSLLLLRRHPEASR